MPPPTDSISHCAPTTTVSSVPAIASAQRQAQHQHQHRADQGEADQRHRQRAPQRRRDPLETPS